MSFEPNRHSFNFKLPMNPNGSGDCKLEMDGQGLKAVYGLHLRADCNGYTNVVIEYHADAMAEFDAALIAKVAPADEEKLEQVLAGVFNKALAEIAKLDGGSSDAVFYDRYLQSTFAKRIIEIAMEDLNSNTRVEHDGD